jgi:protein arginine kinase activator
MLCENCSKKQATFHIKQIINGVCSEKHLCEECSRGYNKLDIFSINSDMSIFENNIINNVIGDSLINELAFVNEMLDNSTKRNRYNHGSNILEQAKNSIINGVKKQEQIYKNNPNAKKLECLEKDLQNAVDNENYEKAAEIKREIDKIKEQGNV